MRPSWDKYFMGLARVVSSRATCDRKLVGAVLVSPDHRVVAMGYNGAPSGMPDCDTVGHEFVDGHCVRTLHAESNALDWAGRLARGCTLYVTCSPCYDCAKRMVNAKISRVMYGGFYESRYGKSAKVPDFLRQGGVQVDQEENQDGKADPR